MSDTPRTDAKTQFFGWNPEEGEEFVTASFARELERENAVLREKRDALSAEVDQWAARCASAIWMLPETVTGGELREAQNRWFLKMDTLKRENATLRADLLIEEERSIYWRDNEGKAMAENAALWADKERMDWLEQSQKLWEGKDSLRGPEFISRAAIDAARKEKP